MSILVVVPVLGRPQNAQPLTDSFAANTTEPARLLFVVSPDDPHQWHACHQTGCDMLLAPFEAGPGDFARKVNLAYAATDEPWIFQAADDVRFQPGWDTALLERAAETGALVVGSNDCANPTVKAGKHATHILFARSYCDDPGASLDGPGVFSEAYGHQYCDTEAVELAKARGVWAFAADSHVVHEHPFWVGRHLMDDTYRRGLASSQADARIYRRRARMFGRVKV